MLITVMCPTL